jgi:hypothetical protein
MIVHVPPKGSFSALNEREGAEIAASIVPSLLDAGLKVLFVTHSLELAHGFYDSGTNGALLLGPTVGRWHPELPAPRRRTPADQLWRGPLSAHLRRSG